MVLTMNQAMSHCVVVDSTQQTLPLHFHIPQSVLLFAQLNVYQHMLVSTNSLKLFGTPYTVNQPQSFFNGIHSILLVVTI